MAKQVFDIKGMTCAACQAHVQKAVESLDGTKNVNVNLLKNTLTLEYDETICSAAKIESAVKDAGYGASIKGEKVSETTTTDNSLASLIFCIIDLLVIMYFSMGHMMWNWPAPPAFNMHTNPMGFSLIQFVLVVPIIFIYRKYFINGFKRLIKKSPNMDTLIAIGAAASIVYGIYSLFMITLGHHEYHMYLYFEAAGMILTLVSLGKYLEGLSKKNTTKALEKLIDMSPKEATILDNGVEKRIKASDIKVGDIIIAKKGDQIAVDGIIIEGSATINEANITGESMPVDKTVSSHVFSSTIVSNGYLKIKAERVGEDTSFAAIIRLVDEASASKAPISKLADKISSIFVPTILAIAAITFIVNYIVSKDFELSLNFAITVVVIACPCALGLATPVSIMAGTGKGASSGLLIKNAEILEKAHTVKTIVFDKTGTITEGKPVVTDYIELETGFCSELKSLENASEHPLAKAIKEHLVDANTKEIQNFTSIDGKGITCTINDKLYFSGNAKLANDYFTIPYDINEQINKLSQDGKTVLLFGTKEKLISLIAIEDKVKESSKKAIELLNKQGIKTIMLTGDNSVVAKSVASRIGIGEVISDVLPQDKQKVISELMSKTKDTVAMVGDGVNDAPALATADIGIAIGAGSDVAIETSDIVLLRNDLFDVVNAINLSKRVIRTIKLGLFWAFFYNAICVVLSTGFMYYLTDGSFKMTPMIGSVAMSISSVSVVLNALTINLFKPIVSDKKNDNFEAPQKKQQSVIIKVNGMMCEHCQAHVEEACKSVTGVLNAVTSLEEKNVIVYFEDEINIDDVKKAIIAADYEVVD
ncbi:MAG: heavy metal translocating P-type ATPase [Clostridia bacterium]|nr:heavy metal translocating P-type ATPase [Clostridia bacterium]